MLKEINILFSSPVENASDLKGELERFYRLKPNKKFLFTGREWYYYRNQAPKDTSWFKKWVKKAIAEKPSIVDTQLLVESAQDMQKYLRNKKGFYQAEVNYDVEFLEKTAATIYAVDAGPRYTINSLSYEIKDSLLEKYMDTIALDAIVRAGDPIDAFSFDLEKQRILEELQNRGFADFSLSYIDIKGDSTGLDNSVDIFLEILNPPGRDYHLRYTLGDIKVFTDYYQGQDLGNTSSDFYNGKFYHKENIDFIVRKKAIDEHIFFNSSDQYSRKDHYKTIRSLTELETYKFSKLSPSISTEADSIIDYNIFLTPHRNRWIMDLGNNFFYSTINTSGSGQRLFGFSISGGLQNRNTFGGAEKYSLTAETGFEFNTPSISPGDWSLNTLTLGLQNNLDIPKLIDVLGNFNLLNRLNIISDGDYQKIRENTETSIGLGYSSQNIVDFYNISTLSTSWRYRYAPSALRRLNFTQLSFDLNSYDIKPLFQPILDSNPLLLNSFEDVLFTGLLFRDIAYYHQTPTTQRKSYWGFLAGFEISGAETFLANKIYGIFSDNQITGIGRFDFANFVKFDVGARFYKQVTPKATFASKLDLGIATPFGDDVAVSYIKQFFSGGPNSIRAWQSRELGPGSYEVPPIEIPYRLPSQQFYQTGDIIIEASMEYRFDLFWYLEGGLVVDAGNVWSLKFDSERPGTQFGNDFLDQMALGAGWGLRWDFDYFLIRFDFGYKLRYPYEYKNNSHWRSPFDQGLFGNVNIAVNYPF